MRHLLERCTFPPAGTPVVCAVSGGPDSTALLVLACAAGLQVEAMVYLEIDIAAPYKLIEAQLIDVPADRRADLELVKNLVHQHTRSLAMFRCDHCGFRARQFYWHCPACGEWETYSPRRTEEKGLPA